MQRLVTALCAILSSGLLSTGTPSGKRAIGPELTSSQIQDTGSSEGVSSRRSSELSGLPQGTLNSPQYASIARAPLTQNAPAHNAPAQRGGNAAAVRIPISRGVMILPQGCAGLDSTFDLLIHFHGAFTTTEPRLMQSGIRSVYVVENLGNFSGPYENAFPSAASFPQHLDALLSRVKTACPTRNLAIGRIALSGWSAGYGAIYRIVAHPSNAQRVDAILLADGMHVGFEPGSHRVRAAAMQPFLDFAEQAASGRKLMAVTHSSIVPPGYASTTATATFLADQLGLPSLAPAQPPRDGMEATQYRAKSGLAIMGFAGGDAKAHCDHLYAIQDTLWSRLRARWSRPVNVLQ
ncbi:MAG TPA: hypothetical protein VFQ61_17780 [Polyangiaceae bacterium]|nr:hypothetical protein [Polyangiaceae bacterium]